MFLVKIMRVSHGYEDDLGFGNKKKWVELRSWTTVMLKK